MNKYIEEMAKEICCYGVDCSECFMKKQNGHCPQLSVAERLYNAGYRKQGGWISVADRLPKPLADVLVCDAEGNVSIDFVLKSSGEFVQKDVTHWMPLPQPPKGE